MAEASDTLGILHQNLIDAGCNEQTIANCLDYARSGSWEQLLPLLSKQKTALLHRLHAQQKQIDCLDFLVYQIDKNRRNEP